ncbi:hypothetical protein L336_0176 [Candidatus Saccharimonas aalborgensis]|uniref:Uncharacterized protein n=2 Tax=Candidatus Saccharimonas aalborgensis TaxID=1332188 RepID=R4PXG6_9BACT|nr:hypothetical protein L336_0176 [Candidatus Saccharimonas aalborgensis]
MIGMMKPQHARRGEGLYRRKIGRKAITSARMMSSIEAKAEVGVHSVKKTKKLPKIQFSRKQYITAAIILILGLIGSMGYMYLQNESAKRAQAVEQQRQAAQRELDLKAVECRARVADQKKDQIGKVTYGELFGSACQ